MSEPVFPADVPTFDKHLVETVFCGEVNVFLHIIIVCGMASVGLCLGVIVAVQLDRGQVGCIAPFLGSGNHFPPHANVFDRLDPRCIIVGTRFVEIEDKVGGKNTAGVVGNHHRAPGCMCGRLKMTLVTLRIGSKPRFKHHVLVVKIEVHT